MGYGAIAFSAALGFVAFLCFFENFRKFQYANHLDLTISFVVALAITIGYPQWAVKTYGPGYSDVQRREP